MHRPLLSVVIASRNDDHGGDLQSRTQLFLNHYLELARRHGLKGELIVVEWNPPADRPSLARQLDWPRRPEPTQVRLITVPPRVHQGLPHSDRIAMFQMIAKNVGIRRAKGSFVLATNLDILFSDTLFAFLAREDLQSDCVYRLDRHDVSAGIPPDLGPEERERFCLSHLLRINRRRGTWLAAKAAPPGHRIKNNLVLTWRQLRALLRPDGLLHYNTCGDFTLMAAERWQRLRGYPELPIHSLNLDSLLLTAAKVDGAREKVLHRPLRIFHQEHASGTGWTPDEGARQHVARLRANGVPWMDWPECRRLVDEMLRGSRPAVCNGPDWGLAGRRLPELDPCRGGAS